MRATNRTLRLVVLAALAFAAASAQNGLKFGNPGCAVDLKDREPANRKFFQLCHSYDLKVPLWVGYVLTKKDLDGPAERPSGFKPDKLLRHPGAKDSDYARSGFSRGHMAPAEDFARSKGAISSTFIFSNVVPQFQRVNGGRWAQLELMVRNLVRNAGTAYVFSGPIFEDAEVDTIGDGQVGIPTHTFKVVLAIGPKADERKMYAVIMPNEDGVAGDVNSFTTTVRAVEDKTGFDFFSSLDRDEQESLETVRELFPDSTTKKARPVKNNKK